MQLSVVQDRPVSPRVVLWTSYTLVAVITRVASHTQQQQLWIGVHRCRLCSRRGVRASRRVTVFGIDCRPSGF